MRKIYLDKNLHICFCVTLMAIMSVSSIIPALPLMMRQFDIPKAAIGWVITAFTLPGIITSPLSGIFADRLGRKTVLLPALGLFAIAGAACFFARDLTTLLALRFVQGIAAGPIGVINLTIIGDLYDGRERTTAMGYNGSVLSIGTAGFPAIGGMLALLGWNWPFVLPLLALPLGWVVAFKLDIPEVRNAQKMGTYLRESWGRITSRRALGLFAISLMTFIILYGIIITYLPVLLHDKFSAPPHIIGWIIASSSFVTALASSQLGRLSGIFSQRTLLLTACVFYGVAMFFIPRVPGMWLTVLPITLFGLGQGLNMPNVLAMLSSLAPAEHRAVFMAANGMVLRLGQTLGPVLMGGVFIVGGMQGVFWTAMTCAALMFLLVLRTQPKGMQSTNASPETGR